ncbi:MAG: dihydrolipoamide acetyltransferase family protein, partial [Vicinamibacteria bacterium]
MPVPVVMPQMGESLSEGTITKWLKKPGDAIERDEPLFEITTDKVDTEVPAPASGVLERIVVREGETVAVGTTVAEIGDSGASTTTTPKPAETTTPAPASGGGHFRAAHEPTIFQRRAPNEPPPPRVAPAAPRAPARSADKTERRSQLSPAVLSLAAEAGLEIQEILTIPGSGRGGRISRRDVERYLEERESRPQAAVAIPKAAAVERATAGVPAPYLYQPEPEDRLVPMSNMRKQIAEHMLWSQQISAQVTSFTECDMQRIVRYREERRAAFEETEGVPLTFLPFVAESTVRALKEFPIFNASVVGDRIAMKRHIHLGVAVALEEGLIVPVVRNADEMNFVGLVRAIHRIAEKARSRRLDPSEVRGGTFTITNPGMFGGLTGTPMIAQPQVAILGLGAVTK